MRKFAIAAFVGALALAITAIAFGATTQTYKQSFSASKPNKSVGTKFSTDSSDPSNTAKNGQPASARQFNIKFPAGTAVDSKAAIECKKSDLAIINAGGKPACPKSVIGSGSAIAKLPFPGFADVNATVTAFDARNGLILYVNPTIGQPFVLRPKFTGNLKNGPTLKTAVPPNCIPPATNQGGQCKKQDGSAADEAVLTHFDLKTLPKKKGKHVLIRSPKKCKGTWKFVATIKYSDGTSKTIPSIQACKK